MTLYVWSVCKKIWTLLCVCSLLWNKLKGRFETVKNSNTAVVQIRAPHNKSANGRTELISVRLLF